MSSLARTVAVGATWSSSDHIPKTSPSPISSMTRPPSTISAAPSADDEQVRRRGARLLEDHRAGREVLDLHARDHPVQLLGRERVERRMLGQERSDVHGRSLRRAGHRPEPRAPRTGLPRPRP